LEAKKAAATLEIPQKRVIYAKILPFRPFGVKPPAMSVTKADLLSAVELALAGEWDAAHELVQQHETDATAAWIHAVLHKVEGDLGNARYWYQRANQMKHLTDEPRAELVAIQAGLTTDEHR
jgi:hypothetical protein